MQRSLGGMENRTVLLVNEDNETEVMYRTLLVRLGYHVLTSHGAEAAVECAAANQPDIIVTELYQRTKTGWKTPQLLKSHPHTAHIPIIVVTSRVLNDDRARAELSGCELFLAKPVTPRELAEHIATVLR